MKTPIIQDICDLSFLRGATKQEWQEAEDLIKEYKILYFKGGWEISLDYRLSKFSIWHRCKERSLSDRKKMSPKLSTRQLVENTIIDVCLVGIECADCREEPPEDIAFLINIMHL